MVVTASRLHAVRYYHEFKRYLEERVIMTLKFLLPFQGQLKMEILNTQKKL